VVSLAFAGAVALAATPADGRIVLQRSIAGVRVGMTQRQVRAVLGVPRRAFLKRNAFGRYTEYRYRRLTVRFQGNRKVTSISTSRRNERTPSGLGVGTTKSVLKARGLHCRTFLDANYCYLGVIKPGRRVTTFFLRGKRVSRVEVGIVID
jgi:hypothetical protein